MKQREQVQIRIIGQQPQMSEETIETAVSGTLAKVGETCVIEYEETPDAASPAEVVYTTLILRPESAEIVRKGALETKMRFEAGKRNVSSYTSAAGTMTVETVTGRYEAAFSETGISAEIFYDLWMNETYVCEHRLRIEIKPGK